MALVAVAAFLPSWDEYEVVSAAGRTTTVTLGNSSRNRLRSWLANWWLALAIGIIAILGPHFWAPPTVGAWMTGGALIALSSQLISAVVQVSQASSVSVGGGQATVTLTWWSAVGVPAAALALASLAL